jgi:hypothetical protein
MILQIIVLTLISYSVIACAVFFATRENETVAIQFGLGIIGWIIQLVFWVIRKTKRTRRDILTRSIFKCPDGTLRRCRIKNANYVEYADGYQIMKRYAPKTEWETLDDISQEVIDAGYKEFKIDEETPV